MKANELSLTPAVIAAFEDHMRWVSSEVSDRRTELELARLEGEKKGRDEGEKKGRDEGEKKGRIDGEKKAKEDIFLELRKLHQSGIISQEVLDSIRQKSEGKSN